MATVIGGKRQGYVAETDNRIIVVGPLEPESGEGRCTPSDTRKRLSHDGEPEPRREYPTERLQRLRVME